MTAPIGRCVFAASAALAILSCDVGAALGQDACSVGLPNFTDEPIRLVTKTGELHGTLDLPMGKGPFPVVVILAGSGPTDRDGNQPQIKNDSLKLLGQWLAEHGIAAVRYDRRGIGESREACLAETDFRFDMLIEDAAAWVEHLHKDRRFSRVGIVGHSEGSLVGMLAAKRSKAACFVSLAGTGRSAPEGLRAQLRRNLPEVLKDLREKCDKIIDELAAGRSVAEVPEELTSLFRPSVQPYLISLFKYDPVVEIKTLKIPVLLVQGTTDLQVPVADGKLLATAKPDARWLEIEGMNHVLKIARTDAEQKAAYFDPKVPLAPGLASGIGEFLVGVKPGATSPKAGSYPP